MTIARLVAAAALVTVLAACEGDRIPPPSPTPQTEGTVQPEDETIVDIDPFADPAPQPGPVEQDIETQVDIDGAPIPDADSQERLREASEEAEQRAEEIFSEVLSGSEDTGIVPGAPATEAEEGQPRTVTPQQPARAQPPADPEARLPPRSALEPDTVSASDHDREMSGIDYIGVWATRPQDCGIVDQQPFTNYAVITPNSIRIDDEMCTVAAAAGSGGSATLPATCAADGVSVERSFSVAMSDDNTLSIREGEGGTGRDFVRCHLPN